MGKLEGDYRSYRATAEALLSELHPGMLLEEADSLRLTVRQRVRVQQLGSRHGTLLTNLQRADEICSKVQRELDDARLDKDELEHERSPLQLSRAVNQARREGRDLTADEASREWIQLSAEAFKGTDFE